MIRLTLTVAALAVSGLALAKIPAPVLDDAAKAKAAETAAKTAWQAKVDTYQLCKAQDKVAAAYKKSPAAAKTVAAPPAAPATAGASGGTPVAGVATAPVTIPPCGDPGPFAYSPPEQKPLETAGAHSPATNATSPPSNKATSAEMAPAKAATAASKKP